MTPGTAEANLRLLGDLDRGKIGDTEDGRPDEKKFPECHNCAPD
jgi:hypothetical protein